jgi:hypothetical protein
MKSILRISALRMAICAASILVLSSCKESPSSPASSGSVVACWTEIDNSGAHSASGGVSSTSTSTVDSIEVISAAFAASGFALRSDTTDSDQLVSIVDIRSEQFILAFDKGGRQYIGERLTPQATFLSARFDLHPLAGSNDSLRSAAGSFFSSLFGGSSDNKTIIIKGNIISGESVNPFVYISTITGAERVHFDKPLVISGNGEPVQLLVKFSTALAFSSGGMMMDPRNGNNRSRIDANLKMVLHGSF